MNYIGNYRIAVSIGEIFRLESDEATFLPENDGIVDRYFNSVNFVDRELQRYIENLAEGTLVLILGDHRAYVQYDSPANSPDGPEYVPLLIHCVGDRLADRQRTRDTGIDLSGELTMVDVASYFHRLFAEHD